ncbi:M23 family metallopeptidase [Bosea robiniae]|jgi:murein DD-endopeptidase MepM/ murein hydrolase activator NlpD|uniref:Murein DD-endopeptidase MepM and murein hydrolase activator NlpD, contain LysM domain n=1 Tax=Bosea robiniae TaxID=1036780 RepID=A0ABY0P4E2_9HYPH|nr:M23 family metallopeptidase [Bosea robiniae]SDH05345.1 Murein DD-endopeptidase MepM and murein hydrolase activator NlpD, contain LysM domain [Bosea robiniae]
MHHQSQTAPALPTVGLVSHKTYTVRRSTMLAGLAWLALSTACSGGAGWYILSRDDLAARLIARETSRQYAYEDRISALRADIDRYASRALLDQDGVESRVDELASRQAEIESRQSLVAALTDTLQSNGLMPAAKLPLRSQVIKPGEPIRASGVTSFAPILPGKPTPAPETPSLRGADSGWQSGETPAEPPAKRVDAALTKLDGAMARTSNAQLSTLKEMDETLAVTQKRLRSALAETGLDADRLAAPAASAGGMGGPFVPVKLDPSESPFAATLSALQPRVASVLRLRGVIEQLPLSRPMAGDHDFTSNFGYRTDPFTRGLAMHTGVDFRAETGSSVLATAPGKVVVAEYNGGYGNMVEVEHANGLSTRYAHMSAISVSTGQMVKAGTVVGRVGTTGRSTGPHLHYETRINDEPVDPTRFLRAGGKLLAKAL